MAKRKTKRAPCGHESDPTQPGPCSGCIKRLDYPKSEQNASLIQFLTAYMTANRTQTRTRLVQQFAKQHYEMTPAQ